MYVNARFLTQEMTGVQRYAGEISRRLKKLLPELRFLCPGNIRQRTLADELDAMTIGRTGGHVWEQIELPRWLRRNGGGLLINLGNTAPLSYRNKIVTIHDIAFMVNPEWYSRAFATSYRIVIPRVARAARHVVTVSEFSRDEIVRHLSVDASRVSVIGNAVTPGFASLSTDPSPDYGRYILALSAHSPRKNFERVVGAFQKVDDRDVKLVIVGGLDKHVSHQTRGGMAEHDPRIVFTGQVNDARLVALYSHALFFVFPSLYEGFGIPPLEAMACGCPCLVARGSSLPEVCGEAALYCDPMSTDEIAAGMNRMLSDDELRDELRERGFKQVKKFDWDLSAAKFAELILRYI